MHNKSDCPFAPITLADFEINNDKEINNVSNRNKMFPETVTKVVYIMYDSFLNCQMVCAVNCAT